jgi:hypothetical protein
MAIRIKKIAFLLRPGNTFAIKDANKVNEWVGLYTRDRVKKISRAIINCLYQEKHDADCICPYDLSFRITGLKPGENSISVYLMDYLKLECNIDFNQTTDTIIQIQN